MDNLFHYNKFIWRGAPDEGLSAKPKTGAEAAKSTREAIDAVTDIIKKIPKAKLDNPKTYKNINKLLKRMRINVKSLAVQKIFAEENRPAILRSIAAKFSKDKTLLSRLATSSNGLIVNQLLWNTNLPSSVLSQIALNIDSYKQSFSSTIRMILFHNNVTPVLKRAIFKKYKDRIMNYSYILYGFTSQFYIHKTPPDVLNKIAYSKLPAAINYYQLAGYNGISPKILHYLSGLETQDLKHLKGNKSDIIVKLRVTILKNKKTSDATAELLCDDGYEDVQVAAVSNPKVRERLLRELLADSDRSPKVKKAIKKALIKRGLEAPEAPEAPTATA